MSELINLEQYVQEHIQIAVEKGWIKAYFQPVVRSITGKITSYEALARWDDPSYGFLTPDIFVPALEKNGDIYILDLAILEIICKNYKKATIKSFDSVPFSFNLSRLDFMVKDIHERITAICDRYHVPHNVIHIEITESTTCDKDQDLEEHIQWFHRDGFEVWMDDFGSGYSTLNTLQTHSFDAIKLDIMFLRNFNKKAELILRSIIQLAKSLDISTVCEGVETQEQVKFLQDIGCERLQGWFYGRPQPLEGLEKASLDGKLNYETLDEQHYWDKISRLDLLTDTPEMIVEYCDNEWKTIVVNQSMYKAVMEVHPEGIDETIKTILDHKTPVSQTVNSLFAQVSRTMDSRKIDFVDNGFLVLLKAVYIVSLGNKTALKVSLRNIFTELEYKRNSLLEDGLIGLYSQFELVNRINPDKDTAMQIYSNASFEKIYGQGSLKAGIKEFTKTEVMADDQKRYSEFMNLETLDKRLEELDTTFITDAFRLKDKEGGYRWKFVTLLRVPTDNGVQYLYEIQRASNKAIKSLNIKYSVDVFL
ncbi:MAG: EAL domain-containing protein [Butyrivibrio sp.]|nr:EAL domain-containing protein [Butyrivibrio sp.]